MRSLLLLITLVMCGCANDLRKDHPFDGETDSGPLVTAERDGNKVTIHIDATNKGSQVFVDLDEGREMKTDEAFSTNGWDISVQRFVVSINSGASNPTGNVEVLVLKGQDWSALTQAPASGYAKDTNEHIFNTEYDGWYLYDLGKHRLTARDLIYVVHTSEGAYVKLRILEYYDAAGTPAVLTMEYETLTPP
jgi:hypothetical protein